MTILSPELALVDPALAASARASLPEPGRFRPASALRVDTSPIELSRLASPLVAPPARSRVLAGRVLVASLVAAVGLALTVAGSGTPLGAAHGLQARALGQIEAARTYVWPTVPGVEGYTVRLARQGETVYEATTTRTSLTLPDALRLAPGRYTWSATPDRAAASGGEARPVVEGAFEVAAS